MTATIRRKLAGAGLLCAVIGAVGIYGAGPTGGFLNLPAELIVRGGIYLLTVAGSLGAWLFILPAKIDIKTTEGERAKRRFDSVEVMKARIEPATEAISSMMALAIESPAELPEKGTKAFSELASFCSGWRAASRDYREKAERQALREANRAIVDFLLILEISGTNSRTAVSGKATDAKAALEQVQKLLQRA